MLQARQAQPRAPPPPALVPFIGLQRVCLGHCSATSACMLLALTKSPRLGVWKHSGLQNIWQRSEPPSCSCLTVQVVVQGIPWAYTWRELKDMFAEVGGVDRADVVTGYDGRSRVSQHTSPQWRPPGGRCTAPVHDGRCAPGRANCVRVLATTTRAIAGLRKSAMLFVRFRP